MFTLKLMTVCLETVTKYLPYLMAYQVHFFTKNII